jgi:hypothetical protein
VGIRYTIIRRASAAGYISPLSSLEEREQNSNKIRKKVVSIVNVE